MNCKAIKITSILVITAMLTISISSAFLSNGDAENEAQIDNVITRDEAQKEYERIVEEESLKYNEQVMSEFGVTYEEFNEAMSIFDGKILCFTYEDGEIQANLYEPINNGRGPEAELDGEYLTIYIDSRTLAGLEAGGFTLLCAAIGSAAGPIGTLAGVAVSVIANFAFSYIMTMVHEDLGIDSGIWLEYRVRDKHRIFGWTFYTWRPACTWYLSDIGIQ